VFDAKWTDIQALMMRESASESVLVCMHWLCRFAKQMRQWIRMQIYIIIFGIWIWWDLITAVV